MREFSTEQFNNSKPKDVLQCKCDYCFSDFTRTKRQIQWANNSEYKQDFCSLKCSNSATKTGNAPVEVICLQCNQRFFKKASQIKGEKHFCNSSCFGTYNAANKITGTRRSKLEVWLEFQLKEKFPNRIIHFNRRDTINSELDIYFPELKLAFELNGIFHYEPIYGPEKLASIQNNDNRKFAACLEQGIELCIIDSSQQKYFKEESAKQFLDIILSVLEKRGY